MRTEHVWYAVSGLGFLLFLTSTTRFKKWGKPSAPKNTTVPVHGPPVQDPIVSKPPCRDLSKPRALRTP